MPGEKPIGAHVARENPLEHAQELGAECLQLFLSSPQSWKKPPERADAEELRSCGMPVYVHAPYLINVCSPKNNIRYGSRKILTQTCEAAAAVGATAVIVHAGHAEDGIEEGVGRWPRTLETLESEVPVYIENTAGGDNAVGAALRRAREALGRDRRRRATTSTSASASTPATRTPPARSSATPSSGSRPSSARSTFCTPTTRATPPARAPTGTRTSARATSATTHLRAMIAAANAPVVVETPGDADAMRADLEFVRAALSR